MSELIKLSGDVAVLQDDMSEIKDRISAHDQRFGNGIHVMSSMKERIEVVEKRTEPKAPDWIKVTLAGLSVVGILMGAQLWLTDRFDDRPTQEEFDRTMAPLKEAQKNTAREIGDIGKAQSAQQTSIKNIEKTQTQQGTKIDIILERLPAKRGSN